MQAIIIVVAIVVVVAIAVLAVARVSNQLSAQPATAFYDIEEVAVFVADELPERVAGRVSLDDVRAVLLWRLEVIRRTGQATFGTSDPMAARAGDQELLVSDHDDMVDEVVARALADDAEIDEIDVVVILDIERRYVEAIGAIGPPV